MGKVIDKIIDFFKDGVKILCICWIGRSALDDFLRIGINARWNNPPNIEITGNETEEEEREKRMQALEDDIAYIGFKAGLNGLYYLTGDTQEKCESKLPFGKTLPFKVMFFDWADFVIDGTKEKSKKEEIPTSWEEKQDDILSIYEGKIESINYEVKYKQHMLAVRDFRRIVRVNNLSLVNYADMNNKEGDTEDKDIRIVYTYDYTNYYANDKDKIDTSSPVKMDKTDKGIKLTKTISVYQDSFTAIPPPNVDSEIAKVQYGFIFEDDPLRTYEEFCQAARNAARTNQTRTGTTYEHAKTHNGSKNAESYFWSDEYYNKHKDKFINSENTMIKANNKDAVQTAFALFCRDIYLNSNKVLNELEEINSDLPITIEWKVRVYKCNFEDRTDETEYEEVNLSEIDWPEDVQNIKEVRNKLPSVGGENNKNDPEIISESELEKKKQEVISGNADLPKINDGEISAEEERNYTVYDWDSIEEVLEEEKEEEEQDEEQEEEKVGMNTNTQKILCLLNSKANYTASKQIPDFFSNKYIINLGNIDLSREDIAFYDIKFSDNEKPYNTYLEI